MARRLWGPGSVRGDVSPHSLACTRSPSLGIPGGRATDHSLSKITLEKLIVFVRKRAFLSLRCILVAFFLWPGALCPAEIILQELDDENASGSYEEHKTYFFFFKLMLCHFPEFADGTLVVKGVS